MSASEQYAPTTPEASPRRRWQWNIATLLLLMAAVSVWTSYFRMKSETKRMDAELDSLLQLARELVIADPSQYAVVERHEQWNAEDIWDVHLPEGSRYLLKLATREIGLRVWVRGVPRHDYPATDHSVEVAAGKHVISLEKTLSGPDLSARVLVDGKPALEVAESDDWNTSSSYSSSGSHARSRQSPPEQPLELMRLRFRQRRPKGAGTPVNDPHKANGVLLWIERQ
jgi:hypothetical protein